MATKPFSLSAPRKGALAEWELAHGSFTIAEPTKLVVIKTCDEDDRAFPLKKNLKPGSVVKRYHLCQGTEGVLVNIVEGAFEELNERQQDVLVPKVIAVAPV
jgi:hypothetical protein